jgi:hypothetical protein
MSFNCTASVDPPCGEEEVVAVAVYRAVVYPGKLQLDCIRTYSCLCSWADCPIGVRHALACKQLACIQTREAARVPHQHDSVYI